MVSVTVLGCDGTFARPDGACSGYLVASGTTAVWLDAGPGTFANLQRHTDPREVTAVVLSHQHPDHWVDLPAAANAWRYHLGRSAVPVWGTAGTRTAFEAVRGRSVPDAATASASCDDAVVWTTIADGAEITVGPLRLRASRTDHPVETLAFRIDDERSGRSVLYSADTGPAWCPPPWMHHVDLAIVEASLPPSEAGSTQHLSSEQAGALARTVHARRLLLTHRTPAVEPDAARAQARAAFDGEITVVTTNTRYHP